ncbi:hypothetical protein [Natrinema altunense]|uniref:Uncharacterized protein n=1 Tax=Natrinema altunense TaxID=222984 RepID=A0A482XWA9_9EURY|nr:hypothetical protein [Natrinema altunense]RZH67851.1 hypothetical protein ELS17_10000 [Natrinema altunense]
MSNDDPRGERSERRHASSRSTQDGAADGSRSAPDRRTDGDTTVSVRARLEKIVDLTGSVLTDVRNPDTTIGCEDIDEETRRDAKRRLREIDAETRRVGLVLFGPDGTLSDGPTGDSESDMPAVIHGDSLTTSYLGPDPGAFERTRGTADTERTEQSAGPTHRTAAGSTHESDRDGA